MDLGGEAVKEIDSTVDISDGEATKIGREKPGEAAFEVELTDQRPEHRMTVMQEVDLRQALLPFIVCKSLPCF